MNGGRGLKLVLSRASTIAVTIGWSPWTGNRRLPPVISWQRCQRSSQVPPFCCGPRGHASTEAATVGTVYVLALVLVNVAALSLHREDAFGVFHALAVASLVTIAVGLSPLLLGKKIGDGHRYPRVLHDVVVRWFGCGRMRTRYRRCWSRPIGVGRAGGDRHGVDSERRHHLRESAVNL